MLGTSQICSLYPGFVITGLDDRVSLDLGLKKLKKSVCYNRVRYNRVLLYYTSNILQVILYKLYYTSYIIQVILYKLYYTSGIIKVILYKLYYTSYIIQVILSNSIVHYTIKFI